MTDVPASQVLFIDDDLVVAEGEAALLVAAGIDARALPPSDVYRADVPEAGLVVLDEYLTHWTRDQEPATTRPEDGLAVGAVLRSQQPRLCVAILTGNLEKFADGIPSSFGEHHIAALRDVEWVFSKGERDSNRRIAILGRTVDELPPVLDAARLVAWLRVPDAPWAEDAVEHATRCRPPLAPRQTASGSRPVLRWFIQRVLPYPTFLLSDARAALRLGVDLETFVAQIGIAQLQVALYRGPLADFLGRRWWRAGVDYLNEHLDGLDILRDALRPEYNDALHVVPLDDQLDELEPAPVADCLPIYPDGWPAFADQAWALRSDVVPGTAQYDMLGLADVARHT